MDRAEITIRPIVVAGRGPWPGGPIAAIALGLVILALPASVEGPTLLPISPGHALSLVDTVGVVPLVGGSLWLHAGLWRRRPRVARWARDNAGLAGALTFAAGLGLGLLLASAFSAFYWWWAVGAAIFAAANVAVVLVAMAADAGMP
jgi:hypothetical protein